MTIAPSALNPVRRTPWAALGAEINSKTLGNTREAIQAAGLDWAVSKRQGFVPNAKGNKIKVPGCYYMVRDYDDFVLGPVKSRYEPFQNDEAFDFADSLITGGEAVVDHAGALKGGKIIFLALKMPEGFMINGEDRHERYILLVTSHDGSKAIGVYLTSVRVWCMNTLNYAIKSAPHKWTLPHVSTTREKLAEARETILMSNNYFTEFAASAEQLVKAKITNDRAVTILEHVFPSLPKTEEKIIAVMQHFEASPTNPYHGTGWGLLNAVTEYQEHGRDNITPESRYLQVTSGDLARWRDNITEAILTTA